MTEEVCKNCGDILSEEGECENTTCELSPYYESEDYIDDLPDDDSDVDD